MLNDFTTFGNRTSLKKKIPLDAKKGILLWIRAFLNLGHRN